MTSHKSPFTAVFLRQKEIVGFYNKNYRILVHLIPQEVFQGMIQQKILFLTYTMKGHLCYDEK
jgi:hypothetical protein